MSADSSIIMLMELLQSYRSPAAYAASARGPGYVVGSFPNTKQSLLISSLEGKSNG